MKNTIFFSYIDSILFFLPLWFVIGVQFSHFISDTYEYIYIYYRATICKSQLVYYGTCSKVYMFILFFLRKSF